MSEVIANKTNKVKTVPTANKIENRKEKAETVIYSDTQVIEER